MKRTLILSALLTTMVAQVMAQQTLYFHYKNGQSFACESSDISSITYAKSVGSDVYDVQVINFNDGTVQQIAFNDIDSVGFITPTPKLAENAVVFDKEYERYIIKGDTVSFTMRNDTPPSLLPKVGDVVGSTFDNTVFEDGIVARVTAVSETAEGVVYTCEKAGIDDIYDEIFYYGYGDIYQDPSLQSAPRRAGGEWTLKGDKELWHQDINLTYPSRNFDDYIVGFGTHVETSGRVKMYIHKPKGGKLYARFNFASDFGASLNASIAGRNGSSTVNPIVPAIPLGVIATPIPIIFFKPELQLNWYLDAFAELNGTFRASMDYEGEIEVTLEDGNWSAKALKNDFEAGVDEFSLSINGWYGIGFEPKIFVSLCGTKTGIGLANRTGVQLTGSLKMDFTDYLADGSLYSAAKDSKLTLSLPVKGILSAEGGLFNAKAKSISLIFVTQNPTLYEGYMLPDFGQVSVDDLGGGRHSASVTLTPRELMPWEKIDIGFAAFDRTNNLVEKKYVDTYSVSNKPSEISTTFSLTSGEVYTISPILNIFGFDIRADRTNTVVAGDPVDLGLSVKWSSFNVGAEQIYQSGYLYQWGVTKPAYTYDYTDYPLANLYYADPETMSGGNLFPYEISGNPTYDASVQWGEGWKLPTREQWEELRDNCTFEWVEAIPCPDGEYPLEGLKVIGPNGNHIYIPYGNYWTGSKYRSNYSMQFYYVRLEVYNGKLTPVIYSTTPEKRYYLRPVCP